MDDMQHIASIRLACPVCGTETFKYEELLEFVEGELECAHCGKNHTKEELTQANMARVEADLPELARPLIEKRIKEMRKELRRAFRGSKHIRIE